MFNNMDMDIYTTNQKHILSINSLWLIFPLLISNTKINELFYIHTIITSLISTIFWYKCEINNLLHKIDKINAVAYFIYIINYDKNTNILYFLYISMVLFYISTYVFSYLQNSNYSMYSHLLFRKIGLFLVCLRLVDNLSVNNLLIIIVIHNLHILYINMINQNYFLRIFELMILQCLLAYISI